MASMYDSESRAKGSAKAILRFSAVLTALFCVPLGLAGALDSSLAPWQRIVSLTLVCGVAGVLIPFWLSTMHIRVTVEGGALTVRLLPIYRQVVALSEINDAESVTVNAFERYGGYGIKGSRRDRMVGLSGDSAVEITHQSDKTLVILTDEPDELVRALKTTSHIGH